MPSERPHRLLGQHERRRGASLVISAGRMTLTDMGGGAGQLRRLGASSPTLLHRRTGLQLRK